jgi:lipid-binding SYLF domain-containing protein
MNMHRDISWRILMNKRFCMALMLGVLLSACTTTMPSQQASNMTTRQAIDANSAATLNNLYRQAKGSRELVAKAKGVLVFPSVLTAGFMVGGSYGEGSCESETSLMVITKP